MARVLFVLSPVSIVAYRLDCAVREWLWAPGFVPQVEALGRVMPSSHPTSTHLPIMSSVPTKLSVIITATDPSMPPRSHPSSMLPPLLRSFSVAPLECAFWQVPDALLTPTK